MSHHHHNEHSHEHVPATGNPEDLATCPVMHIPVNKAEAEQKGHVREYTSVKYYLCCATCTAQFDENPSAYIQSKGAV